MLKGGKNQISIFYSFSHCLKEVDVMDYLLSFRLNHLVKNVLTRPS